MVQVLPYVPSFGERALPALGGVIGSAISQYRHNKKEQDIQQKDTALLEQLNDPSLTPVQRIALIGKMSPGAQKTTSTLLGPLLKEQEKGAQRSNLLNQLQGLSPQQEVSPQAGMSSGGFDPNQLSDQQLAVAATDPTLKPFADQILANRRHEQLLQQKQEEIKHKRFVDERDFAYKEAKPAIDRADTLRDQLPQAENALAVQRAAVQEGDLSFFSRDSLAELTGLEGFRSAEGAIFKSAGKEYFLNNLQRVGGRPNQWIEQQLVDMQAKIGRSQEANEAVLDFQEFKVNTDKAWLNTYNELTQNYRKEQGYVPGDIGHIVDTVIKPYVEHQKDVLAYKLREHYEAEMSPEEFSKMKKVPHGTPLTVRRAKFLLDYFKDTEDPEEREKKAEAAAKKLGYTIVGEDVYGAQ